jgi:hypothetical protein
MTKSSLRLGDMEYHSTQLHDSAVLEGVQFRTARMSFRRRLELTKAVRDLVNRIEYHESAPSPEEKLSAAILTREVEAIYLKWGLLEVCGLVLDGRPATVDLVLEAGPEAFVEEILEAIKTDCGLTDDERKNS